MLVLSRLSGTVQAGRGPCHNWPGPPRCPPERGKLSAGQPSSEKDDRRTCSVSDTWEPGFLFACKYRSHEQHDMCCPALLCVITSVVITLETGELHLWLCGLPTLERDSVRVYTASLLLGLSAQQDHIGLFQQYANLGDHVLRRSRLYPGVLFLTRGRSALPGPASFTFDV